VVLRWDSPSTSADQILYRIRISHDSGQTWQVLSLDWPEPDFAFFYDLNPNSKEALDEIQASD
jgi:hypothetical protein